MTDYTILPDALVQHARMRGGVFTSQAANRFGLHAYAPAIEAGECHRICQGLYSLNPELDTTAKVWAGLHIGGPDSTVGGAAAAWVRGEGPEPEVVDIWCGSRKLKDRGHWRFHHGDPDDAQPTHGLNEAFGQLLLSPTVDTRLASGVADRALRLQDRERFLDLCTATNTDGRSVFETTFNRDVLLAHGLPLLDWQHVDETPHLVAARLFGVDVLVRFDASAAERQLRTYSRWERDEKIVVDPDKPQVITWADVLDGPCNVASVLARRLRLRAWQGELLDCRRCTVSPSSFSMMRNGDRRSLTECPTCGSQLVQLWRMPTQREEVY